MEGSWKTTVTKKQNKKYLTKFFFTEISIFLQQFYEAGSEKLKNQNLNN